MKMAALQLMQHKANKDANKTTLPETPALPSTETPTESKADSQAQKTGSDVPEEPATDVSTEGAEQTDSNSSASEESSKLATNGPLEPAATQNGEYKSPLEGKELEESIPGLAQAKELAESLVAEDGSGIGTSKTTPHGEHEARPGRHRESCSGGLVRREKVLFLQKQIAVFRS